MYTFNGMNSTTRPVRDDQIVVEFTHNDKHVLVFEETGPGYRPYLLYASYSGFVSDRLTPVQLEMAKSFVFRNRANKNKEAAR